MSLLVRDQIEYLVSELFEILNTQSFPSKAKKFILLFEKNSFIMTYKMDLL